MEQTRQKRTAKGFLAAVLTFVVTIATVFAILPQATLTARAEGTTVNLSTLTEAYTAQDGEILTGTLGGNYKISIADGATVTLKNAIINGENDISYSWAGITCLGDATIILEGENTVKGFYEDYSGIYVPDGKTLTIEGEGTLSASSNGYAAGIGANGNSGCGNIVINDGVINATGGSGAAGIGGSVCSPCGDITINGGTVTATGSVGIGAGNKDSCGDITISGGNVTAIGGNNGTGIGSGFQGSCGAIAISGGTVTATGGDDGAGIGSGATGTCGNITIANTVTKVTATKGENATNSIGIGNGGSCGTVTIGGVEGAITKSPYTYTPFVDLSTLTADYVAQDGEILTGTLGGSYKLSIAAGATITLDTVTINYNNGAGITCNGDATIVLEGTNSVRSSKNYYAGIFIQQGGTLTIKGSGSLTASGARCGAGIGGNTDKDCGKIVIESGTINAYGGYECPGIGSGCSMDCDGIEIKGGTVYAKGNQGAAGIGTASSGFCGDITISGGKVTAEAVTYYYDDIWWGGAGIGSGVPVAFYGAECGNITISGGNITATGAEKAPAIGAGSGYNEYNSSCGDITITDGVGKLTLTKGSGSPLTIGGGVHSEYGNVSVFGVNGAVTTSPYTYLSEGVDGVIILIDEINPVDDNGTCRNAVVTARAAYDKLTNEDQAKVTNYDVLTAAEEYFTVDLSALSSEYVAKNGDTLTGTLGGNYKITIASGATVTLKDVTINNNKDAGLICNGATLILKGKNTVRSSAEECPGILVADYSQLTISGDGSLDVYGATNAAGIGGRFNTDCGTIVIESGTITAHGGTSGAGIGSGNYAACSGIEISGGIVKAYGGEEGGAGIGTGAYASYCAYINISGGRIYAQGTDYEYEWGSAGIGTGVSSAITSGDSTCEKITITGGNIEAVGGPGAAAIGAGSGYKFYDVEMEEEYVSTSECNEILITDGVGKLKATKGSGSPQTIGGGKISRCVWGVKVLGGGAVTESPYNYLAPGPAGVIALIDEIPNPVVVNNACRNAIAAARAAYDKLENDDQKALVTNYDVLTDAESVFAIEDANAKLDKIPDSVDEITLDSKADIAAARAAYDALGEKKNQIDPAKVTKLEAAEAKYAEVKEADDTAKANNAMDKINAIGEVEYTPECKAKIDAARTAYDALTDDQKAKVTNYNALTEAESSYQVAEAEALIDAIGTVEYAPECKAKIDEAKAAYDALTPEQKAKVTNYNALTEAESSYQVAETEALIAAIGEVEYTPECKAKIDEAQTAFDALNADQQNKVNNSYALVYARQDYRILEATALIDAIGTVEYTAESKAKIDAARTAYDDLGAKLQPSVMNYETLTKAEADYAALKADNEAAEAVVAKINAIGTVEYTAENKAKIDEAKAAYEALTPEQKALVNNANTLTTAETTYATLKADHEAAEAVVAKINAIGTVEYTAENKAKIDEANAAYEALTPEQKALVNNANTLTTAETTYATLKADNEAAVAVVAKINAIGTVEYTAENKAKIDEANAAYEALTPEQKALVTNYSVLTTAEQTYAEKETEATAKKGLPGGVIALIVILSVLAIGCGAFAIVWFVVKKKTWAAFVELVKACCGKVAAFFRNLFKKK